MVAARSDAWKPVLVGGVILSIALGSFGANAYRGSITYVCTVQGDQGATSVEARVDGPLEYPECAATRDAAAARADGVTWGFRAFSVLLIGGALAACTDRVRARVRAAASAARTWTIDGMRYG